MKRIMVVFLSIMMIVSLAAASFADSAALSCSATNDQLNRGDSVTVTVSLSGAPDVKSMNLQFDIPTDVFTVDGAWSISGTITNFNKSKNLAVIAFESPTNINGSIFTLNLTVKDDAAYGDYNVEMTPIVKVSSEAGETEVTCAGTSVTLSIIDPSCHHENMTFHEAKDSTCNEQGWDAYYTCPDCGLMFAEDGKTEISEIPLRPLSERHTGGTATCKDPAVCTVCGESYGKVDPLNHTGNTEIRNQKDATCTENGNSGDTYCKDCGALISAGSEIKALGHDYKGVVTEPTCKAGGYTTYTCSRCEDSYVADETDPVAHDYEAVVTEPTCKAGGYTTYTCKFCGDSYTGDETKSLGHDYKDEVTEPTCTEKGYTTHTCSRCGDSYTDTETEALGHDYKAVVTEPTCTEKGYTTYTCSRCNDTYKDDYTDTVPHTLEHVEGKEATCTEKGALEYWKCSVCSKLFSDENGETEITEKDIVIKALGHEWGAWKVTKAATLETTGSETRTCERCGEVQTRIIPSLGHKHAYHKVEAKEATCEENGNIEYYECVDCGLLFKKNGSGEFEEITIEDTVTEALGHDFGEWITTTAPTETTEGEQTRTCSRNWQHVETRTVPKADHVHDLNHIAANKATCDQPGNTEYWVCSTCNRYFSDAHGSNGINANDVIIAPAEHQWGEWVVTKEAKAGEKGEETRTCIYDSNHKETREIPALPETENTDAQTEEPSTETPELPEITVPENEIIENPDTQTEEPSTVAPELPEITVPENEIIENPETANDENTAIWLPVVIIALLGAAAVAIIVIRIKKMTAPEIL